MVIKKLYLDPFLDMFNGEILSYSITQIPSAASILSAQKKAIEITSDCPYRRTFHSDRGWAYQMPAYSHELEKIEMIAVWDDMVSSKFVKCLDGEVELMI
jgi:transposase InsO family protein